MTKIEKELLERLRELDIRISVLEAMPTPIIFAIGKYPHVEADMQEPNESEH